MPHDYDIFMGLCKYESATPHASVPSGGKIAAGSTFSPVHGSGSLSLLEGDNYVTGFQYFHSKKIGLRMATEKGHEDKMILNALCKPFGINMRITMPNWAEWQLLS